MNTQPPSTPPLTLALAPDPEAILRQRAVALARPTDAVAVAGESLDVVEFLLGGERYAVETRWVREVLPAKELTLLPGTPAWVVGIMNVRGQVLAVLDLRKILQVPSGGISDLNKVLIWRGHGHELGVLADAIAGVRQLPLADLQPVGAAWSGLGDGRVRGVGPEHLVVLDAGAVLADPGLVVNENVGG